jgi:autotransporter-associated beta strand protein
MPQAALATSGTWLRAFGGSYDFADSTNWVNGNVPAAADELADFSRFNLQSGDMNVTLSSARTIGQLLVGDIDTSSAVNAIFGGAGTLTFATTTGNQPLLTINSMSVFGNVVQIDAAIAGTNGFNKIGAGILVLNGVNTYSGATTITAGTLRASSAANFGASTVVLNGGTLDLRNNSSTNFGIGVTLSANSQINVNGVVTPGDQVGAGQGSNQIHTIGAVNFGAAGSARTLTITNYRPVTTVTPTPDSNFYGLTTGVMTLNDSGNLISNIDGTIQVGGINSTSANASTLTIGGSTDYAGNITISGAVTQGAGPLAITFNNNRTLILAGALSHTGGTNVTGGGTVQLASGVTMPSAGPVTITNGTLDLNSNSSTIATLTMGGNNGTLLTGAGTLTLGGDVFFTGGAGTANLLGNFNLGAVQRTFNITQGTSNTPEMVINGPVGDSGGGLVKSGNGTLRLTGNNTSTGMVTINSGTLLADARSSGSSLGAGAMNIVGGALGFGNVSAGASGSTGTLTFASNNSSGTFVIDAAGQGATTLNLTAIGGRNAGATGVLTVIPNTGTLDTNEIVTVTNTPSSLILNGILPAYMATQNSGGDTALDFLNVSGGHLVPAVASYSSSITAGPTAVVALTSGVDAGSGTTQVFGLKVSNGATVSGTGTLLIGDGTNPAGLIIDNGSTIATSKLSFGTSEGIVWSGGGTGQISSAITLGTTLTTAGASPLNFNGPLTFNPGSNINVNGATATINTTIAAGNLVKQGPGILVIAGDETAYSGTLTSNSGTLQIGDGNTSGTLNSASKLVTNANIAFNRSDAVTIGNDISGGGNVVQNGSGTTNFSGNLSYTGSMVVVSGTARTINTTLLPTNSSLTVNGGTFDLNGFNQTIQGVNSGASSGSIITSVFGPATLTLAGSGSFNGVIANGSGTVAVVKNTGGNQIFNGVSTYTGGTQLNGGTLTLRGLVSNTGNFVSGTAGTQTIVFNGGILANGADPGVTLNVGNRLSVPTGNVGTILMGNRIAMGSSATGQLTGGGTLNLVATSTAQRDDLQGLWNVFTGTVELFGNGTIRSGANGIGTSIFGMPAAWLEMNDSVHISGRNNSNGNDYPIGALSSSSPTAVIETPGAGGMGRLQVGLLNKDFTFAGQIQGNNQLGKLGSGKMLLTNDNPYTGNTIVGTDGILPGVPGGSLVIGSGGNLSGTGNIIVNDGATFAMAGTGTITSAATLSLVGTGALDVTQRPSWSTPSKLTITGSSIAGAKPNVYSSGHYLHNAGTINPGAIFSAGTIDFPNGLDFLGGTGAFDLNGTLTALGSGTNDLIDVTGGMKLSPSHLRVNFLSTPTNGNVWPLVRYDSLTDAVGSPIPSGPLAGWDILGGAAGTYTLANDPANKVLTLTLNTGTFTTLAKTWTGAQSSVWETGASANWKTPTGVGTVFFLGDSVTFLDNGAPNSVVLNSIVTPANTTFVNSALNYTLTGSGGIAGSGALIKMGTGTLMLGDATAIFTGGVQLKEGVIDLNTLNQDNTSTVRGAGQIVGSNLLLGSTNAGSIVMSNNTSLYMGNFTGNNSQARDAGQLAPLFVDTTGGTSTATLALSQRGEVGTLGTIGGGTATLNVIASFVRDELRGDMTAFHGQMNVLLNPAPQATAELSFGGHNVTPPVNPGLPNGTLNIADPNVIVTAPVPTASYVSNLYQLPLGALTGVGTLGGGTLAGNTVLWNIGSLNTDFMFAGTISNGTGPVAINKTGTGIFTLTGTNINTGSYTVSAGTLKLDNGGSLRTGTISVASGGTFQIGDGGGNFTNTTVNVLANGGNFTVPAGFNTPSNMIIGGAGGTVWGQVGHGQGTISPGTTGSGSVGTLTFHDGLTISGGALIVDLNKGVTTPGPNDSDLVKVLGQVDLNSGTILINPLGTASFVSGTTYNIMSYGTETGSISNFSLGIRATATLNDDHAGNISLTITNVLPAATLSWVGNNGSLWDVAGTVNWKNGVNPDKFFNGDTITFDDTASNFDVVLNSYTVTPAGTITFNNSNHDYTLSGAGTIGGAANLTMNGSRMLTLNNQNSYTGGTQLNAGTVGFTTAQPFTGTVTFNGGQLAAIQNNPTPGAVGGALGWAGATLSIATGKTGTINLVANNNFASTALASNAVQLFQQSITAGGTLTGGGNAIFITSNVAQQPNNNVLLAANVSPEVDEVTDINTNVSAYTGTVSFVNSGQYPATGSLAALGTTIRMSTAMGLGTTTFYDLGNQGTFATSGAGSVVFAPTGTNGFNANSTYTFGALSGQAGVTLKGFEGVSTSNSGGDVLFVVGTLNKETTFAGTISDSTGTVLTNAGTNSNLQQVFLNKVGTANFNMTGTSTFTGALSISAGTVTFSGGASLGTPTINLNGGTLNVAAVTGGYSATNTTITGSGSIVGNVSHLGSILTPGTSNLSGIGGSGAQGTLTFANNYTSNSGTFNIDLGTPAGLTLGGTNDAIKVNGTLTYTGQTAVNFNFTSVPTVGTYSFLQAATTTGSGTLVAGDFGLRPTASVSLDFSGGITKLVVNSIGSQNITWAGRFDNVWSVSTTQNWTLPDGSFDHFFQLDNVVFDDTSKNATVNVSTTLRPSSVIVNNSAFNYAFNGSGKITGPTSLIKNGTATLSLAQSGTNDYTGGTVINAGTIDTTTKASIAIGSGTVTFNGGALTSNAGGTAVTFTNPLRVNNGVTGTLTINGTGAAAFNGAVSGNGTLLLLTDFANKAVDFNGSVTAFGGQLIVQGQQSVRLSSVSFSGAATYTLLDNGTLSTSGGTTTVSTSPVITLPLGGLNGSSTSFLKGYNGAGNGTGGFIVYQIGDANGSCNFAGNVVDGNVGATVRTLGILKSGTGTQVLSGSNSYTGVTQVNSGTLVLTGPNAWAPALSGTSASTTGASVLNGGRMVFNYTGNTGADPAAQIKTILNQAAFNGNFLVGQLRTTNVADGRHAIGWFDNGSTAVNVGYTYMGDFNVDGVVNTGDFNALALHYNNSGLAAPGSPVWGEGDANYDGHVNALDFNAVATNFGAAPIPSQPLGGLALAALVPEPASMAMIGIAATALLARRRRKI